jgi:CRP/FNR family transcriptional regulator
MQVETQTDAVAPAQPITRRETAWSAPPSKAPCSSCHLREICLPSGLTAAEMQPLDGLLFGRRSVKEGQAVFHEGDVFQYLYAVRSGTFKSVVTMTNGREQVTGFDMAGELMGLDSVATGRHGSTAIALEDADICSIPYGHLSDLACTNRGLQQLVSRLMSHEIVREHGQMALLGTMNADERVSAFLLNISRRLKARGYSAREFHLRMTRADIGSFLGMNLETVSRTLSDFQQRGLLEVRRKHVRIVDHDGLTRTFEARVG